MKNLILYKKGESSFISWVKKRIKSNLNFICLFQGSTGIGKTWSAISMAYMIDPSFESKQIIFDPKSLMDTINADWFKAKKWKIIIFDEPQISISNRNWQSTTNKLMNYLLSTFRHQNCILIFCSPYVDFLDSQSMKLLHCIFECKGVNRKKKMSLVKPKLQQYNSQMKKTYQHPLYVIRGGKVIPLREWMIPKPPQHLIEEYEEAKTNFTNKLNQDINFQLSKLTKLGDEDKRKPLTEKQRRAMELLAIKPIEEVAKIIGVSVRRVYELKRSSVKKGYDLEEFKSK